MHKSDVSYLLSVLLCGCAPAIGAVLLASSSGGGSSGGGGGGGPQLNLEQGWTFPPAAAVAAGDIDGDSDVDLVFGLPGGNTSSSMWTFENVTGGQVFYTGTTPGTVFYTSDGRGPEFAPAAQYGNGNFVEDLFLVDVDRDGDLDLVVNIPPADGQVWLNDGRGTFTDSGQSLYPPGSDVLRRLAVGDLDDDQDPDVVTVDEISGGDSRVNYWLNDGSGVFTVDSTLLQSGLPAFIVLGDVDDDGDQDLLREHFGLVEIDHNDGQGRFTGSGTVPLLEAFEPIAIFLGDIDRDGDADVIGQTPAAAWYSLNEGDGINFAAPVLFSNFMGPVGSGNQGGAFGDVDRNGSADLVVTLGAGLRVCLDVGDPAFALGDHRDPDPDSSGQPYRMILVDIDRDGDRDMVVASTDNGGSGRSHMYRNRGLR